MGKYDLVILAVAALAVGWFLLRNGGQFALFQQRQCSNGDCQQQQLI